MRRLNDGKRIRCEAEDRISNFSDDLIRHILSFVPTKLAVATGILSKRWKELWIDVPVLDLDNRLSFPKFDPAIYLLTLLEAKVNSMLEAKVESRPLNVSLRLRPPMDLDSLELSIHKVLTYFNVEKFDLEINGVRSPFTVPVSLFTSLTSLKLHLNCNLECVGRICFEKLKILSVVDVKFSCKELTDEVHFEFPELKEFYLSRFELENIKTVLISAAKLMTFVVKDTKSDLHDIGCKIKVDAKSLSFFRMKSNSLPSSYYLGELTSPEKVSFNVYKHAEAAHVDKLLRALSGVKDLQLHASKHLFRALKVEEDSSHPQTFPRLTKLTVIVKDGFLFSNFIQLLHKVPNLESLVIIKKTWIPCDSSTVEMLNCPMPHLKSVKLDVSEYLYDQYLLNFFLNGATFLEKMLIILPSDPDKQTEIMKPLQKLRKRSSKCTLQFEVQMS